MDKFAQLCAWSLVLSGVVFCVTTAKVGAPIRALFDGLGWLLLKVTKKESAAEVPRYFIRCPGCVGWWAGFGWSFLALGWPGPAGELLQVYQLPRLFCDAFAASAVCWIIISTVNR